MKKPRFNNTGNKTMTQHTCEYCNKTYLRNAFFKKHIILCELIKKTPRERELELNEDLPTYKELYLMVQELGLNYVELSKKNDILVKELVKVKNLCYKNTSNKKENLADKNENDKNENDKNQIINLQDWLNGVQISDTQFEEFVKNSCFLEGILGIFLYQYEQDKDNTPIKIKPSKEYTIYVVIDSKWKELTKNILNDIIKKIQQKLIRNLSNWQSKHAANILNNKDLSNNYTKYLELIMMPQGTEKLNSVEFFHKFRNKLFDKLKNLE